MYMILCTQAIQAYSSNYFLKFHEVVTYGLMWLSPTKNSLRVALNKTRSRFNPGAPSVTKCTVASSSKALIKSIIISLTPNYEKKYYTIISIWRLCLAQAVACWL